MKRINFELITIGNELLIGKILNTNMQWLTSAITELGGNVVRVTTVGDYVENIASALLEAFNRKADFIITCGGLGPTFDDKTLEALSKAVNMPLELDGAALRLMKKSYKFWHNSDDERYELTPSRLKMARLPYGAEPLYNPVGSASGVYLKYSGTKIVALPGVPVEMKTIFKEHVAPIIRDLVGDIFRTEGSVKVTEIGESNIAPLIDEVMNEFQDVYVKSHPKREPKLWLELHFSSVSNNKEITEKSVREAMSRLSKLIINHGGKVEPII